MHAAFLTGEVLGWVLAHLKTGREGSFSRVYGQKLCQSANQYWFPENSSAGKKIIADSAAYKSFLITKINAFLSIANIHVTLTCLGAQENCIDRIRHAVGAQLPVKIYLHYLTPFPSLSREQGCKYLPFTRLGTETQTSLWSWLLGFLAKIECRKVYGLSSGHMAYKSRAGIQTQFTITGTVPFDVVIIDQMSAFTWKFVRTENVRTGWMAQWLGVFAALVEDLRWVPSTHLAAHHVCNSSSGIRHSFSGFCVYHTHDTHTNVCTNT